MSLAAIVTMIGLALLALAVALFLVAVVWILYRVNFALGTVLIGVRAIARQARPLDPTLAEIRDNVTAILDALGAPQPSTPPAATAPETSTQGAPAWTGPTEPTGPASSRPDRRYLR